MIWHRRTVAKTEQKKDHEDLNPKQAAELAAWWLQAFEALNGQEA